MESVMGWAGGLQLRLDQYAPMDTSALGVLQMQLNVQQVLATSVHQVSSYTQISLIEVVTHVRLAAMP